jgi:hypothetical protein
MPASPHDLAERLNRISPEFQVLSFARKIGRAQSHACTRDIHDRCSVNVHNSRHDGKKRSSRALRIAATAALRLSERTHKLRLSNYSPVAGVIYHLERYFLVSGGG